MRAATVSGFGSSARIVVGETAIPTPGPRDVLVKVYASSVNPKDWKLNKNLTTAIPDVGKLRPFLIGDDLSGEVVERGEGVTEFEIGDEVYGMDMRLRTSACAEYAVIAAKRIARKPKDLSHVEAGVVPLAALTALQGFRLAKVGPGSRALVIGASGGVGTYAVQIGKALGAQITGVCSSRNTDLVKSLGADAVIDYTAGDYRKNRDNFDMVFDVTAYETPHGCKSLLKKGGIFVTTSGHPGALLGNLRARLTPGGPKSTGVWVESYTRDLDTLREMIESGKVKTVLDSEFPLEKINDAYERSKSGRARGKIAIVIAE